MRQDRNVSPVQSVIAHRSVRARQVGPAGRANTDRRHARQGRAIVAGRSPTAYADRARGPPAGRPGDDQTFVTWLVLVRKSLGFLYAVPSAEPQRARAIGRALPRASQLRSLTTSRGGCRGRGRSRAWSMRAREGISPITPRLRPAAPAVRPQRGRPRFGSYHKPRGHAAAAGMAARCSPRTHRCAGPQVNQDLRM